MSDIIDEKIKLFVEHMKEEFKERVPFELGDTYWTDCLLLEEYMREPTTEESESVKKYIDSISEPTGVKFDEIIDKLSQVPEVYAVSLEELRRITNEVNNNSDEG